ncbi:DUF4386 domain-containing protein [Actinomycetes bacterium KLBMP 9797]
MTMDFTQRRAARVVGFLYLFLMAVGLFAQVYVPASVTVAGDAAATARAIVDAERLYRLSIVGEMICFAGDTVLAVAFYVLLRPVGRHLAMLGAFFRLAQVAILTAFTLCGVVVLQLLSGADETRALTADQSAALAWVVTSAHGLGYQIGFAFLGLGSAVFSYLLFRSGYVPRLLAGWGVFASAALTVGSVLMIAVPETAPIVNPALFVPIFIFEVTRRFLFKTASHSPTKRLEGRLDHGG